MKRVGLDFVLYGIAQCKIENVSDRKSGTTSVAPRQVHILSLSEVFVCQRDRGKYLATFLSFFLIFVLYSFFHYFFIIFYLILV